MGTFNLLAPKICIISYAANDPPLREVSFKTSYHYDPWTLKNLNNETSYGMAITLSLVDVSYKAIQDKYVESQS